MKHRQQRVDIQAVALTRHNIHALDHDAPFFERPDGLQSQDGEMIAWGRYAACGPGGSEATGAVNFTNAHAVGVASNKEAA